MNYAKMLGVKEHEFRLVFGCSRIEYDPAKESINRQKHQYSLESAVLLLERMLLSPWNGSQHVMREIVENGEPRQEHMCLGDAGEVLFMVTTMRTAEVVRIISLRKAHENERQLFFQLTSTT